MNSTNNEILPQGYKMTELGALPEEWKVVRLGGVIDLLRNGITKQQNKLNIGIPISRIETISAGKINTQKVGYISNLSDDEIEKYKVHKGDILLSHINSEPYLGNSAIYENAPEILIHGMNLLLLRVNKNVLSSEYLNFLFNYYREKNFFIKIASRSVNQSSINQAKIKSLPLPLPPLPEQKRIAAVLFAVQEAKEKTQAVIDATKALKKSMMKHLFTYGPVPPEEAENVPLKETELGKVPEEWEVVKLGEVAEVNYGKANTKDKGNIPVVGSGGVYSSTKTPLVDYPTIVIGRKGTAGKAWLFVEPCYPSDTTFYLRWKKDIDLKFLYNYMVLNPLSGEHAKTTLPSLQKADLINYLIPLPPLPIQQKIASILSAIDAKIEAEENKKKSLEDLFKTLLHNLMTAKIRVDKHRINLKENEL